MDFGFWILTFIFIVVSVAMILIILVQRPQGGGLSSAFGGAGGGTDTVFGGRTGDALTWATVGAFSVYLLLAVGLNMMDGQAPAAAATTPAAAGTATGDGTGVPGADGAATPGGDGVTVTPMENPADLLGEDFVRQMEANSLLSSQEEGGLPGAANQQNENDGGNQNRNDGGDGGDGAPE